MDQRKLSVKKKIYKKKNFSQKSEHLFLQIMFMAFKGAFRNYVTVDKSFFYLCIVQKMSILKCNFFYLRKTMAVSSLDVVTYFLLKLFVMLFNKTLTHFVYMMYVCHHIGVTGFFSRGAGESNKTKKLDAPSPLSCPPLSPYP